MAEADLMRVRLEEQRLAVAANTAGLDAERARIQRSARNGESDFSPLANSFARPRRAAGPPM